MKKVGNLIKKSKAIYDAFTHDLPTGEKWYEDRLKICTGCEYNSENVTDKSFGQILREAVDICPEKRHCRACGCCIDRKAALKYEECGIVELGKQPLWIKLEHEDNINKGVSVTNLSPDVAILRRDVNRFYLDAGDTEEKVLDFNFRVFTPIGYKFKSAQAGCSCTVAKAVEVDENNLDFNVRISTLNFRANVLTEKNVSLYYDQGNLPRVINIKFQMVKK